MDDQPADATVVAVLTATVLATATPFGGTVSRRYGTAWHGAFRSEQGS